MPKKPPKEWFDKMKKEVAEGYPTNFSEERIDKIVGDIWYNELSENKRQEILKKEGNLLEVKASDVLDL